MEGWSGLAYDMEIYGNEQESQAAREGHVQVAGEMILVTSALCHTSNQGYLMLALSYAVAMFSNVSDLY